MYKLIFIYKSVRYIYLRCLKVGYLLYQVLLKGFYTSLRMEALMRITHFYLHLGPTAIADSTYSPISNQTCTFVHTLILYTLFHCFPLPNNYLIN